MRGRSSCDDAHGESLPFVRILTFIIDIGCLSPVIRMSETVWRNAVGSTTQTRKPPEPMNLMQCCSLELSLRKHACTHGSNDTSRR
jgi:hypothetical protein